MKAKAIFAGFLVAAVMTCLSMASPVSAREVITINMANGGSFNVTAYNTVTKSYYYINGTLTSDSYGIIVPNGYGCIVAVTKGRAVGSRNLYEHNDPMNPIFEVTNKSLYVLELVYKGHGSSSVQSNSAPLGGILTVPGSGEPKRMPPP